MLISLSLAGRSFWATDDRVFSTQSGAIRTNCIDSLDRSNVVQSALARAFLNRHLVHLGVTSQQEEGLHDALDVAFNGIWADNGDAISREYAGTSALKVSFCYAEPRRR
jgi:phosphatidylinositol 4-phosphatase